MSTPERLIEQATDLIRRVSSDARERKRRRRKRRRRMLAKLLRTFILMLVATLVIVVGMVSSGFLFGPRAVEGLITAPIALVLSWAAILYWSLQNKSPPRAIVSTDLAQLPSRTEEWLEHQRATLPALARNKLDAISQRLEAIAPQVQRLDPQTPAAFELRRLIGEELPELVRGYQNVPRALQTQPLHGGHSPDRRLAEGLSTIDEALEHMHARLAADDLHALATQQRYLEIKYKGDKLE